MAVMKTPGVYIVEKDAFPNSIVQVATAVPVFIGHTEKAVNGNRSLRNQPWRISSMAEFDQYFGGPAPARFNLTTSQSQKRDSIYAVSVVEDAADIVINGTDYWLTQSTTPYLMYSAMRLFFQNGGGPCYIVSIGGYDDAFDAGKMTKPFVALEKEQEPTLVVIPEAVRLSHQDCNSVQQAMLTHCARMMSRFAVLDIWDGWRDRQDAAGDMVDAFRNALGINNLNYGAAYYPWVNSTILQNRDVTFSHFDGDGQAKLQELLRKELLPGNPPANPRVALKAAADKINAAAENADLTLSDEETSDLTEALNAVQDKFSVPAAKMKALKSAMDALSPTAEADTLTAAVAAVKDAADNAEYSLTKVFSDVKRKITKHISDLVKNGVESLQLGDGVLKKIDQKIDSTGPYASISASQKQSLDEAATTFVTDVTADTALTEIKQAVTTVVSTITGFKSPSGGADAPLTPAQKELSTAIDSITDDWTDKADDKAMLDKMLRSQSLVYRELTAEVAGKLNLLPPSSAMVGIYTMVDATRGVWKAPANVSLSSVVSPTVNISNAEQEDLNVTPMGKSINAIRPFIGEGVLVWGARTLDGNSLDWRYINVRRTMIMIEESVRLAAKAYVFEPNTANTWVTVKSMISNFLNGIWKAGGLAGAVPEDAFSVHVGLGETMTPNDILEGILRVTVLLAPTRPAEFIEITFQQQQQRS